MAAQEFGLTPIDRFLHHDNFPSLSSADDIAEFETTPYEDRVAARSTYEVIQLGASIDREAPAIQFLPNADPDEAPITISFGDFTAHVTRAANLFHAHGVGKDDVVSLLLPLVPQAFVALFGAEAAGIANPVNPLLAPHQLAEILRAARTKVLVVLAPTPGTDIWEKVSSILDQLPELKTVIQVGAGAGESDNTLNFDAEIAKYSGDALESGRVIDPTDTAAYFHTGGTTGTPKLVRHTHGNQVYQAWGLNVLLPSRKRNTVLFGLPLFHVGGALTQGLANLAAGCTLVVVSAAGWRNPSAIKNVWRLVHRYKPANFGGVPTVLGAAVSMPVGNADTSSVMYSSGGGSAIPVAVGEALQKMLRVPVIEVYGMTETASVHTLNYPNREIRLGAVGHALPHSKVRIVKLDADGNYASECEANEIGVVAMSGPGVFTGYMNDEHNAGAFIEPGWVNSGDLGRVDEDGYLWITGRAKDLIIRGGHNIDPAGVEEVLYQHPAVEVAALVGQPDAYAGELPTAYVQLRPDAQATSDELIEHIAAHTPERAAVPVGLQLMDAIPLTGVGKVFKPALRWDAATRVFSTLLEDVGGDAVSVVAKVAAHGTHGSLTTITVSGAAEDQRETIAQAIAEKLAPFAMQSEVQWAEQVA